MVGARPSFFGGKPRLLPAGSFKIRLTGRGITAIMANKKGIPLKQSREAGKVNDRGKTGKGMMRPFSLKTKGAPCRQNGRALF
ncbi:hypothetical protein B4135_3514 [Caldibacillus debilis]|uniref:Uncharacterized protein n=1 Tax=Caldibacillus debilis TaxID=301148 RepID=A0A150LEA4_9BACI|nr:hypothetical protein B4135_3514 [Caldibacillus debilis]